MAEPLYKLHGEQPMKKTYAILFILISFLVCAGCAGENLFREETQHMNKVRMGFVGTGKHLLKIKKIDMHTRTKTADGIEIDTWVIKAKKTPTAATVVILHGTGESKANYLEIGVNLAKRGYDTVLIDLRRHGYSTGDYITCGAKEKQDVKQVVDKLASEQKIAAKPVYVLGFTFGASVAIQYAAIEPNVSGVVAVAPWKDTESKVRRDLGLMISEQDFEKILAHSAKKADFDPAATSACNDAAKLKCPVYLIHGMVDLVVPLSDSEEIYRRLKGPRQLKIVTPGPEQLAIAAVWDKWMADQVEQVVKGKLEPEKK